MSVRWAYTTLYPIVLTGFLVSCGMDPVTESRIVTPTDDNATRVVEQDKKIHPKGQNSSVAVETTSNNNTPPPLQTKTSTDTRTAASGSVTSPSSIADPAMFMQSAQDLERLQSLLSSPTFSGLVSQLGASGSNYLSTAQLSALLGSAGGFSNLGANDLGTELGGIDLNKLINSNLTGVIPQATGQSTATTPK